jgi:outer membrane protein OmpA-like peptidoglycan-associated protein
MARSVKSCRLPATCSLTGFVRAVAVVCVPMLVHGAEPAQQGGPTALLSDQQIEEALHPPRTRSLPSRSLTRRDAGAQSVSLNIQFEHNSSALQPQASAQLNQLLLALTSPSLRKDRFQVAGHTDAKGARQFNKRLSLRRAEAVKDFLVAKGMDARRMDTIGYGSERLLAPDRPDDSRNRRVEIRDLGESSP